MSISNNFDIDQTSSKFSQRCLFVCYFYCKNKSILGILDDAKTANCLLFYCPPYITITGSEKARKLKKFGKAIVATSPRTLFVH